MINRRDKGQRNVREVERLLKINNFLQVYKAPHGRMMTDLFMAWDIIAIREDLVRVFIQVKSSASGYSSAKKQLQAWVKMFGVPTEEYILLLVNGKKDMRKFDCRTGKECDVIFITPMTDKEIAEFKKEQKPWLDSSVDDMERRW